MGKATAGTRRVQIRHDMTEDDGICCTQASSGKQTGMEIE